MNLQPKLFTSQQLPTLHSGQDVLKSFHGLYYTALKPGKAKFLYLTKR